MKSAVSQDVQFTLAGGGGKRSVSQSLRISLRDEFQEVKAGSSGRKTDGRWFFHFRIKWRIDNCAIVDGKKIYAYAGHPTFLF